MIHFNEIALNTVGIFGLAVGAIVYIRSTTRKVNDSASVELIANLTKLRETDREEFTKRIKLLEDSRAENQQAIARLEGQVAAYKDIPLQSIAASMEKMAQVNSSIAESNAKILQTLQQSAVIAATDRDVLTAPTSQIISEQTVEHQTVKEVK